MFHKTCELKAMPEKNNGEICGFLFCFNLEGEQTDT